MPRLAIWRSPPQVGSGMRGTPIGCSIRRLRGGGQETLSEGHVLPRLTVGQADTKTPGVARQRRPDTQGCPPLGKSRWGGVLPHLWAIPCPPAHTAPPSRSAPPPGPAELRQSPREGKLLPDPREPGGLVPGRRRLLPRATRLRSRCPQAVFKFPSPELSSLAHAHGAGGGGGGFPGVGPGEEEPASRLPGQHHPPAARGPRRGSAPRPCRAAAGGLPPPDPLPGVGRCSSLGNTPPAPPFGDAACTEWGRGCKRGRPLSRPPPQRREPAGWALLARARSSSPCPRGACKPHAAAGSVLLPGSRRAVFAPGGGGFRGGSSVPGRRRARRGRAGGAPCAGRSCRSLEGAALSAAGVGGSGRGRSRRSCPAKLSFARGGNEFAGGAAKRKSEAGGGAAVRDRGARWGTGRDGTGVAPGRALRRSRRRRGCGKRGGRGGAGGAVSTPPAPLPAAGPATASPHRRERARERRSRASPPGAAAPCRRHTHEAAPPARQRRPRAAPTGSRPLTRGSGWGPQCAPPPHRGGGRAPCVPPPPGRAAKLRCPKGACGTPG